MGWATVENGDTLGTLGSESGTIMMDEEHDAGARITLERSCEHAPFAITCGIYGWMFHTRYFGLEREAVAEYEKMKVGLDAILDEIPLANDPEKEAKMKRVQSKTVEFVEAFP